MKSTKAQRDRISREYIKEKSSGCTLRSLQTKHGFDFRTIGCWVKQYKQEKKNTGFQRSIESSTKKATPAANSPAHASLARTLALEIFISRLHARYGIKATITEKNKAKGTKITIRIPHPRATQPKVTKI